MKEKQLPIGKEALARFSKALESYRSGKRAIEARIIEAEEFWKLRHWRSIRPQNPGEPEPASGWLVNAILSKHSDAMDAYPEALCLPREESDRAEAQMLSSILPVILGQNDFQQVWSDVWWYKLKSGTGVYGVFWDKNKLGGLGDISIKKVDILNLFWEPGITDLQDSRYLFHVVLQDDGRLEAQYPQLRGCLGAGPGMTLSRYHYDENIPTAGKSAVVDVYYKKEGLLHFCKFVGDQVLFATENDPHYAQRGLYDHGRYPFVFDPLFPEEGYPGCGYGYVDLCKEPQKVVDILNNCFVQSAVAAATPRWFIRSDGGVNEAEYADLTKKFVHVQGRVDTDSILQIRTAPMPAMAVEYMQMKVNEIKEVSGNRDVNNGSTSASVTAASAIAALQEAGNGLSRDMISASYRAFRHVVELCIELMRQFYDVPRRFRIAGGAAQGRDPASGADEPGGPGQKGGQRGRQAPVMGKRGLYGYGDPAGRRDGAGGPCRYGRVWGRSGLRGGVGPGLHPGRKPAADRGPAGGRAGAGICQGPGPGPGGGGGGPGPAAFGGLPAGGGAGEKWEPWVEKAGGKRV